jgi:hypothetical protein
MRIIQGMDRSDSTRSTLQSASEHLKAEKSTRDSATRHLKETLAFTEYCVSDNDNAGVASARESGRIQIGDAIMNKYVKSTHESVAVEYRSAMEGVSSERIVDRNNTTSHVSGVSTAITMSPFVIEKERGTKGETFTNLTLGTWLESGAIVTRTFFRQSVGIYFRTTLTKDGIAVTGFLIDGPDISNRRVVVQGVQIQDSIVEINGRILPSDMKATELSEMLQELPRPVNIGFIRSDHHAELDTFFILDEARGEGVCAAEFHQNNKNATSETLKEFVTRSSCETCLVVPLRDISFVTKIDFPNMKDWEWKNMGIIKRSERENTQTAILHEEVEGDGLVIRHRAINQERVAAKNSHVTSRGGDTNTVSIGAFCKEETLQAFLKRAGLLRVSLCPGISNFGIASPMDFLKVIEVYKLGELLGFCEGGTSKKSLSSSLRFNFVEGAVGGASGPIRTIEDKNIFQRINPTARQGDRPLPTQPTDMKRLVFDKYPFDLALILGASNEGDRLAVSTIDGGDANIKRSEVGATVSELNGVVVQPSHSDDSHSVIMFGVPLSHAVVGFSRRSTHLKSTAKSKEVPARKAEVRQAHVAAEKKVAAEARACGKEERLIATRVFESEIDVHALPNAEMRAASAAAAAAAAAVSLAVVVAKITVTTEVMSNTLVQSSTQGERLKELLEYACSMMDACFPSSNATVVTETPHILHLDEENGYNAGIDETEKEQLLLALLHNEVEEDCKRARHGNNCRHHGRKGDKNYSDGEKNKKHEEIEVMAEGAAVLVYRRLRLGAQREGLRRFNICRVFDIEWSGLVKDNRFGIAIGRLRGLCGFHCIQNANGHTGASSFHEETRTRKYPSFVLHNVVKLSEICEKENVSYLRFFVTSRESHAFFEERRGDEGYNNSHSIDIQNTILAIILRVTFDDLDYREYFEINCQGALQSAIAYSVAFQIDSINSGQWAADEENNTTVVNQFQYNTRERCSLSALEVSKFRAICPALDIGLKGDFLCCYVSLDISYYEQKATDTRVVHNAAPTEKRFLEIFPHCSAPCSSELWFGKPSIREVGRKYLSLIEP